MIATLLILSLLQFVWIVKINHNITQLNRRLKHMAGELDALKAAVAANTTLTGSAIEFIQGLKAALDQAIASGDPAALAALSAELGAKNQELAEAIVANTPQENP